MFAIEKFSYTVNSYYPYEKYNYVNERRIRHCCIMGKLTASDKDSFATKKAVCATAQKMPATKAGKQRFGSI
uniref:Uncharacterized protein n=1 Tax=Romanomermis culicivorax TaxID=13658 RepID=A0A915I9S0_ROMCU